MRHVKIRGIRGQKCKLTESFLPPFRFKSVVYIIFPRNFLLFLKNLQYLCTMICTLRELRKVHLGSSIFYISVIE